MLTVLRKTVNDSDIYVVISEDPKTKKHFLFLEWDDVFSEKLEKETVRTMVALNMQGILIRTPRGFHFIASNIKTTLKGMVAVQKLFVADPVWILHNKKREFATLRVSIKYKDEKHLEVVQYPLTDEKLKQEYEAIIKKYFYKGDPYMIHSDSNNGF